MPEKKVYHRGFHVKEMPQIFFVLMLSTIFSFMIDGFFTLKNFEVITRQVTTIGIVSLGMTLVIITGGIDLSVGAMLAFSINIGGQLLTSKVPIALVYLIILLLGTLLGTINGLLIVKLKVPALIVTLGTMNVFRGVIMVITRGKYITSVPGVYMLIGKGYTPFIILLVLLFVFSFILHRTKYGRNLVAIGSNDLSAVYSGVPVDKYKIITYATSGLLSALAGIIIIGRSGFIQPQAGIGYEMSCIAAVVIGGTSIYGGSGTMYGTFLGSMLMGLILAGITMLAVNAYWQGVISGLLIILAISFDTIRYARRRKHV